MITMIITLVIFCTLVTGIAGMEDMKKVGRVGWQGIALFRIFRLHYGLADWPARWQPRPSWQRIQCRSQNTRCPGSCRIRGASKSAEHHRLSGPHYSQHRR